MWGSILAGMEIEGASFILGALVTGAAFALAYVVHSFRLASHDAERRAALRAERYGARAGTGVAELIARLERERREREGR